MALGVSTLLILLKQCHLPLKSIPGIHFFNHCSLLSYSESFHSSNVLSEIKVILLVLWLASLPQRIPILSSYPFPLQMSQSKLWWWCSTFFPSTVNRCLAIRNFACNCQQVCKTSLKTEKLPSLLCMKMICRNKAHMKNLKYTHESHVQGSWEF